MKNLLKSELSDLGIDSTLEIEFIHTPPYSPDYNLVEYLIHQLRLKLLHHQPAGTTIEMLAEQARSIFTSSSSSNSSTNTKHDRTYFGSSKLIPQVANRAIVKIVKSIVLTSDCVN